MIGIIAAMQIEADSLIAEMTETSSEILGGVTYIKGILRGKNAVVAVCGIGKCFAAMCAQTMILRYQTTLIINTGVAGALSEKLDIYDIAIATSAVQHDYDITDLGEPLGAIPGTDVVNFPCEPKAAQLLVELAEKLDINVLPGVIATGDIFVSCKERKAFIRDHFTAIACEMEGGAIAQVCYVNGVECAIIRSISDNADGVVEEYETFKYKAAENSCKLLLEFLANI